MLKLTREGNIQLARSAIQLTMSFAVSASVSALMRTAVPMDTLTRFGQVMVKIGNYGVSSVAGEVASEYFGKLFDSTFPNDVPHLFKNLILSDEKK